MKRLVFTCTLFAAAMAANAQKLYLKAGGGYMLPVGGQTIDVNGWPLNGEIGYNAATWEISSFNVKAASFAAGTQLNAGIGLMVSDHVGFELNGMLGLKSKVFSGTAGYPIDAYRYRSEKYSLKAEMPVLLNPSLVLKTGNKVSLYSRIGLLLPVACKMEGSFEGTYNVLGSLPGKYSGVQEYKTKMTLGTSGSIGMSVELVPDVNLWLEASFSSLSIYVKEKTYIEYEENGINSLDKIPAENRVVSFDASSSSSVSRPTYTLPFSSAGFSAGLSLSL
jgi:hypothetical protein